MHTPFFELFQCISNYFAFTKNDLLQKLPSLNNYLNLLIDIDHTFLTQ